ncbi:hydrogen gas-evolving membrane-bound hydrogenase subunit E [Pseudonocardia nematodicida]|uniref:Hydrogen gas-evolving membrane-bound hydrogenase subunit E n=1 Tax=Pseudonocardia nematodicida TaxID=1206997 RepID=A0ABV1KJY9_9PSEU
MISLIVLGGAAALALLGPLLARFMGRNAGYPIAAGLAALAVLANTSAGRIVDGDVLTASYAWMPSLGISFGLRMDGLSLLFVTIVLGVGALVLAYCPSYLDDHYPVATVYGLLTGFAAAMIGLVTANDLVLLYVFWELTTVLSFLLINTAGPKAAAPAGRALIVTAMGGFALLGAVVMIGVAAGTTDLGVITADPALVLSSPLAVPAAALLILAAATKSAQLPFTFWLPGAMVAMTPISAYLHAATMVKAGIYLLMRFSPVYVPTTAWSTVLVPLGLLTAVVGAVLALREHDLKAILAHSTVSQLGLITAAIGVGTSYALSAAVLHTFAHALFKATLFMLVGIIDKEAGSRDVRELGGLRQVMPVTATLTGIAALSMAGIPPLIGFVSKETLFEGFLEADFAPGAGPVAATAAVIASVLTFAYSARIVYGAFFGTLSQPDLYEPRYAFLAPAAVAALLGVLLGPLVSVLNPLTDRATTDLDPGAEPVTFELWPGITPALFLSLVTVAAGYALFHWRDRVDALLGRLWVPDGAAVFDRIRARVLDLGALVGRPDTDPAPAAVLVRPVLLLPVLAVAAGVLLPAVPAYPGPVVRGLDWVVLGLVLAVVLGAALTRSPVAALATTGFAGLTTALWLLLAGAPDVALTLLLVEILTTVVAVLVLRGRGVRLHRPTRWRRIPAAVTALAAGLSLGAGTLALTGRREPSAVGNYLLDTAEPAVGGTNVVNTILVDFRGMDTFGEAVVVGAAALGLLVLIRRTEAGADARPRVARDGPADTVVMRVGSLVLAPLMGALSLFLLWRGHDEPGGGFIASLVAGVAVLFLRLAHRGDSWPLRLRPEPLVGAGLLLSLLTGLAVMPLGLPFLTPVYLPGEVLLSSFVFDLGIFSMVVGLMVAAVDRLGGGTRAGSSLGPVHHRDVREDQADRHGARPEVGR